MAVLVDKSIPTPRYHQLKDIIRRKIKVNKLPAGRRVDSVVELMAEHKISRATAMRALSELVDEGVLYTEVGMGTYVADPAGKKTHTICFVVHSGDYITAPYFSQIISGISRVSEKEHYKLQFITSARAVGTIGGSSPYPSVKENKWADGLIIMDNALADDEIAGLAEKFPVVLVSRWITGSDIAYVRADDRGGTYEAISYLASLGHKRIGMIAGPEQWQADQERLAGYKSAVNDFGLDADESLVASRGLIENGVIHALDVLLGLPERPTAVFVCDDVAAFEVLHSLQDRGIRVPQDVAVMSFDGCLSNLLRGQKLTTMRLPLARMGESAAKILMAQINNEKIDEREVVFSPELVIRQSSGEEHVRR